METTPTILHNRDFPANKQRMSGVFRRMRLVYTICTAIFGNGAAINGTIIITAHRLMEVLGKLERVIAGSCAVVRGSTIRGSAVRLFVAAVRRRTATGASVFGLLVLPRGLPSTLLFYSFALFFLLFLLSATSGSIFFRKMGFF